MSTFTVTNTNNSGAGSLRQAVLDANALTGKDIINFGGLFTDGLAHTISLTSSGLSITDNLTIEGTNPSLLTIKDNSADRVFDIGKGVTAAINGLTITNRYKGKAGGGAISNEGVLTLNNSIITGNTVYDNATDSYGDILSYGGGIYNTASLTVNYSTISNNSAVAEMTGEYNTFAEGGGIYNSASLTVNHSTISNDLAKGGAYGLGYGGGIYNSASLTVNHSTISNDLAKGGVYGFGGGIESDGIVTVKYSNISDNQAYLGGGINNFNGNVSGGVPYLAYIVGYDGIGSLTVNSSNITGNTAYSGGGIANDGSLTLNYSNIAGNTATGFGGGGIYNANGSNDCTLNYSNIVDNTAMEGEGGGISNTSEGTRTIPPSSITVNYSTINGNVGYIGGGVYNGENGNTVTFNYSIISDNTANGKYSRIYFGNNGGGGIFNSSILWVNHSTITGNTANEGYGHGGGIYNAAFTSVSNSTISDNYASNYGGGIYNSDKGVFFNSIFPHSVTVSYSSISGNTAGTNGGGIYNEGFYDTQTSFPPQLVLGVVTVSYSTISNNQSHFGGGIYNGGTLTVGNSTIMHNKAFGIELSSGGEESGDGGGIYNYSSSYATATVDYSTIACNFDTSEEDSTKVIKSDDLVGKFITKYHHNRIGNLSGSTFS